MVSRHREQHSDHPLALAHPLAREGGGADAEKGGARLVRYSLAYEGLAWGSEG